ncbi:MAG: ABC transporter substrate-binding protein [Treponema sp.]|jgi:polar amino acid transport system substrate-binding protein|nr:ABC transporter substrate-binding protein [Treponema sp.]
MNLKKMTGMALAALVLVSGVFAGGNRDKPQQPSTRADGITTITPGVLTIGIEIGYPPMEYFDMDGTTPIGFDVEMANALGAKLGFTVKFVDTAWDGIFAGVNTGKYDLIISAVTITDERLRAFNFTKSYIANTQALVLSKNSGITAKNPEELGGLDVAYQAETASDVYMTTLAGQGLEFTPREYDKVLNCFDELKLGRVSAVVCDSVVAFYYAAQTNSPFDIVWQGEADEKLGICFKKGNDPLTAAVDKALDELFADGTMVTISKKIFGRDLVTSVR